MKLILIYFTALLVVVHSQFPFRRRVPFKDAESVVFTAYNSEEKKGSLHYAPADPDSQVVTNDFLNATRLIYTADDDVTEYWGLAASYETDQIFFNNYVTSHLIEFDVNEGKMTIVANDMTSRLDSIAFDRVTKTLYWADSENNKVMALEKNYRYFTAIWESDEFSPRALTIHLTKRKLFFAMLKTTGQYISGTEILKCNLDGSGIESIMKFPDVLNPRSMTIDYSGDKLYWTDVSRYGDSVVMACDLNGNLRREFFSTSTGHFWGIAHYKTYFYVTDMVNTTESEYDIHIRNSDGRSGKVVKVNLRPRNIAIYAPNEVTNTPIPNECSVNQCNQLCLASAAGRSTCKCAPGFTLKSGTTCEADTLDDNYLLIADLAHRRLFQLGLTEFGSNDIVAVELKNAPNEKIYAATVDMSNGDLAWYNLVTKEIVWGDKKLSFPTAVISIVIYHCEKKIFWSSGEGIYSWDGKRFSRSTRIYSLDFFSSSEIRQIEIDVIRGHIYWVEYDQLTKRSKVMRSDLKGRKRQTVLEEIAVSKGITIDYESYTLYVLSMIDGEIYSLPLKLMENIPSTLSSYYQYKIIRLAPYLEEDKFVFSDIAVVNGWIYLSNSQPSSIQRFNLRSGPSSIENYGPDAFYYVPTLKFYNREHYVKYIRDNCPGARTTTTTTTTRTTTTRRPFRPRPGPRRTLRTTTTTPTPDTIIFTRKPSGTNAGVNLFTRRPTTATTTSTTTTNAGKQQSVVIEQCEPFMLSKQYMAFMECMVRNFKP